MSDRVFSRIVRDLAHVTAERLTRRAIRHLQKSRHTLSGYDSELKTTWDEICVQTQGERSFFWDAYEQAMHDALAFDITKLQSHEKLALWLQSPEGEYWETRDEETRAADPPVSEHDIALYLINCYLLPEADRWSNARITAFLDRASLRD